MWILTTIFILGNLLCIYLDITVMDYGCVIVKLDKFRLLYRRYRI